ncbi:hypothetical protein SFC07_11200 [Corynebacterium callunae]|uniref:hypothetical protein n=1 Tax=Corynebacterium callunae TaxID=1721 RepID=UPI003981B125
MKNIKSICSLILSATLLAGCSTTKEPSAEELQTVKESVKEACFDAVQDEVDANTNNASGSWAPYEEWTVSERESSDNVSTYAVDSSFTPLNGRPLTFSCLVDVDSADNSVKVQNKVVSRVIGAPTSTTTTTSANEPLDFIVNGTSLVGVDILPGTYRYDGSADSCYWARLSGFSGTTEDIIANGNPSGQAFVTIEATDKAFQSNRCGLWTLVESDSSEPASNSAAPAVESVEAPAAVAVIPTTSSQYVPPAPRTTTTTQTPVIGITGAPGTEPIRELDKTIASCGDPTQHQAGTTFFTDGTSGWTEFCSDQMLISLY